MMVLNCDPTQVKIYNTCGPTVVYPLKHLHIFNKLLRSSRGRVTHSKQECEDLSEFDGEKPVKLGK